jgi:hypothetical protein
MRPDKLARVAVEAEMVRLRRMATRTGTRAILAVTALLFVLGALVLGHVAAWYLVRIDLNQSFLLATAILGGGDLLIAILFGALASRSSPSRVEKQALKVRRDAVAALGGAFSITQMALPLLQYAPLRRRRRRK